MGMGLRDFDSTFWLRSAFRLARWREGLFLDPGRCRALDTLIGRRSDEEV